MNVSDEIDRSPIGAFQIRVVALCALVALLDGLDIQTMALVTPVVAADWGLKPSAFGLVLSATFAGIMAGALIGGLIGDRIGRRSVLIGAFLLVGVTSVATAFAQDTNQLILARLLTGFGIGCCMPNFTSLTAEYVPARNVALVVTIMYSAVPLGGVLGGYIAPFVIEAYGWRAVFVLGGVIPLVIAALLMVGLPESIRFLVNRGGADAKVGAYLQKIRAGYRYEPDHSFELHASPKGGSLPMLFQDGRATVTLVLWTVFFFSLFGMYLLVSWLPTVFAAQGWPRALAIQSASNFQLGGIVGGIVIGWLIDRFGPYRILAGAFFAAAVMTAAIGVAQGALALAMTVIALSGFAVVGAQLGMTALAANIYPTAARSTGVGWALGIGRAGAVVSPAVGGMALAAGWDLPALFAGAAVAPLLCALATLLLWRVAASHRAREAAAAA